MYTFLGWYFDKVIPQEFGVREKPWYVSASMRIRNLQMGLIRADR